MAKKAAVHRLSNVSKMCDVRTGLWRRVCEEPKPWPFCSQYRMGSHVVYSLQERSCSSEHVLCFVIDMLYTPVLFTGHLYSPKTQTLKQNVTELLCFHGKQSCFSHGKQRCNDCLWGGDPLPLTSLFSAYSFVPL